MPEKEPQVTFTDRRKISSDGEIRPGVAESEAAEEMRRQAEASKAATATAEPIAPAKEASPAASPSAPETHAGGPEEQMPEGPTAKESADSNAAYQETTQQLDELLRAKAPGFVASRPHRFRSPGAVHVHDRDDEHGRWHAARRKAAHRSDGRASDHRFAGRFAGENQGKPDCERAATAGECAV